MGSKTLTILGDKTSFYQTSNVITIIDRDNKKRRLFGTVSSVSLSGSNTLLTVNITEVAGEQASSSISHSN